MKFMKTFKMAMDFSTLLYEMFPTVTISTGFSAVELYVVNTVTKATESIEWDLLGKVPKWVLLRAFVPANI